MRHTHILTTAIINTAESWAEAKPLD